MTRLGQLKTSGLLAAVLLASGCVGGPYFDGNTASVEPTMFVAIPSTGNSGGFAPEPILVVSTSLDECIGGQGVAEMHSSGGDGWTPGTEIPCRELTVTTAAELREVLDARGYDRGTGPLRANRKPLETSHDRGGYHRLAQGGFGEYYVRYNDTHIRDVWWTSGNRWGTETEHNYTVQTDGSGRQIESAASESRQVALEWFPEM